MEKRKNDSLQQKIFFTLLLIVIIRMGNYIPVPNIDQQYLKDILSVNPSLKSFFNTKNLIVSIFSLGIIPNINASIIMQLIISAVPYFEKLQKEEGENGRKQIKNYTRGLTFLLAFVQSISIAFALRPIVFNWNFQNGLEIVSILSLGSMIILWFSELITEKGIGNGSSIIITLNILSGLPNILSTVLISSTKEEILVSFLSFTSIIIGIIYVQEAVKKIPLISGKQLFAQQNLLTNRRMKDSYLPLRINQGGVMPIIFSSTFLTFLTIVVNYAISLNIVAIPFIGGKFIYGIINFTLIIFFSLFYSNLMLNPKEIAKELNRMSVTIPNIRPGLQTASFLKITLNKLSIIGAIFLAILVAIPNLGGSYGFGVTSLLILVGVTIEITRQIQTLLISEMY
jgi:preprotein translocase subunit SecY